MVEQPWWFYTGKAGRRMNKNRVANLCKPHNIPR